MKLFIAFVLFGVAVTQHTNPSSVEKMFNSQIDTNGNHKVELSELMAFFNNYDLNHDDKVPITEYLKATGGVGPGPAAFFSLMDPNKDGTITKAEMTDVLAEFDLNKDGTVNKQEFIKKYINLYNTVLAMQVSVGK